MTVQHILVVNQRCIAKTFASTGFYALDDAELTSILASSGLWIGPRSELETDESFRQLIPYVILVRESDVVCYRRAPSGTEQRLHGLLSIGIGGHVDLADIVVVDDQINLNRTLLVAAEREIAEEVGAVNVLERRWVGVLLDNDTPVGRVHLGVVGIWVVADAVVRAAEDALREVRHISIDSLRHAFEELETWSAMLLPRLAPLMSVGR